MKEKKFERFFFNCMIVFAALMLIVQAISNRQFFLNHFIPFGIYILGTILGMIILYWIRRGLFKIRETIKVYLTDLVIVVKNVFLSGVVFGSLTYWSFCYFNNKAIENSELLIQQVAIDKISLKTTGTRNSIYFVFMNTKQAIHNFVVTDVIQEAAKSKNYKNYRLNLSLRRGLLTSYVIDKWSVTVVDN